MQGALIESGMLYGSVDNAVHNMSTAQSNKGATYPKITLCPPILKISIAYV